MVFFFFPHPPLNYPFPMPKFEFIRTLWVVPVVTLGHCDFLLPHSDWLKTRFVFLLELEVLVIYPNPKKK